MGRKVAGALLLLLLSLPQSDHVAFLSALVRKPPLPDTTQAVRQPLRPVGAAAGAARQRPSGVPRSYREAPLAFLSRAPADSLACLDSIGPILAARICDFRRDNGPFTRWKDLLGVRGIGPGRLRKLMEQAGMVD